MRKIKAIILAGGEGTRLRPLTFSLPKAVVPLINEPFLSFQINLLKKCGVRDIYLTSYYLMSKMKKVLGNGSFSKVNLFYSLEKLPMGTAGGVGQLKNRINSDELLIVLNGDVLTDINLSGLIEYHLEKKSRATIVLTPVKNPSRYGLVIMEKDGRIKEFREKPKPEEITGNLINAGIYLFEPELLDFIPKGEPFSFERQFFPLLLEKEIPFFGYVDSPYWLDIGLPEKYLEAQTDILYKRIKFIPRGTEKSKNVFVGKNTKISSKTKLKGPVVIGSKCVIEENSEIGENVVIGNNCHIKSGAILKNCLLWSDVIVNENAILSGCILANKVEIGNNAHIGPGVILGSGTKITKYSILNKL